MDIKVYGTVTSGHQFVMSIISDLLLKAKIDYTISEINDISQFIEKGIDSIPAIQMNNEPIISLKSNESFSKALRCAANMILSSKNYGAMVKYIIPVDFSENSLNALSYGHRLATDLGAVTKLLHVYRPKAKLDLNHAIISVPKQKSQQKLDNLRESMDVDWSSDILKASLVSSEFRIGFPVEGILDSIKENDGKLVIMGTTGADNVLKRWFGSVSLSIIQKSICSIIMVPKNASYKGVKKAMLAVDHTGISDLPLDSLTTICSHFKTELHIVHISDEEIKPIDIDWFIEINPQLKIKSAILHGEDIIQVLNEYAQENSIDLVALSPKSKSVFSHLMHGSVTEKMSMNSSSPILILK